MCAFSGCEGTSDGEHAEAMMPGLSLVLGGARSGKSRYAESMVRASGRSAVFIATAEAGDEEMRERIARHRAERGTAWRTVEAPHDLVDAIGGADASEAILIDCATLWLSNRMLAGADVETDIGILLQAIAIASSPVAIVSNEVGQGVVPESALARRFRDAQGRLNQAIAAEADFVALVVAGLPLALKGNLP